MTKQVFNRRYEVLRHIARGSWTEVYLAIDTVLDRQVALKILFPELTNDRSFLWRFRREIKVAATLSHPNIISVYDLGEEDDSCFIVMEYISGGSLDRMIREEGSFDALSAAYVGADVAAALSFAHRNGVIHGDMKPKNVLMTSSGHVKVTDFAIARAPELHGHEDVVIGDPRYLSPEVFLGNEADPRSDVYALGTVLYDMVAGRPPFTGDDPVAIAYQQIRSEPPSPSEFDPTLPPEFEEIVLATLAKDPSERYPTIEALREDLLRFIDGYDLSVGATAVNAPSRSSVRVFISYRHDETEGHAGRLYDTLVQRFGEGSVFLDANAIRAGDDFLTTIDQQISESDAVLVLIGRQWLTLVDSNGRRRLDDPRDIVRIEIETALERNVRVIPVLVQGALMPKEAELPASLSPLSRRHAMVVDHQWHGDIARLVTELEL